MRWASEGAEPIQRGEAPTSTRTTRMRIPASIASIPRRFEPARDRQRARRAGDERADRNNEGRGGQYIKGSVHGLLDGADHASTGHHSHAMLLGHGPAKIL